MKKLFFSLVATVMISSFSFANTNEIEEIKNADLIEINETDLTDSKETAVEDWWFCYETGRTRKIDLMTGDTIITVYVKCTWYTL